MFRFYVVLAIALIAFVVYGVTNGAFKAPGKRGNTAAAPATAPSPAAGLPPPTLPGLDSARYVDEEFGGTVTPPVWGNGGWVFQSVRTNRTVYVVGEGSRYGIVKAIRFPKAGQPFAIVRCEDGNRVTFVSANPPASVAAPAPVKAPTVLATLN